MLRKCNRFPGFLASLAFRLIIAVLTGALLLTLVYCIPGTAMEQNVASSAMLLTEEGLYPWLYPWCTSMMDNFTDAVMLATAARNDGSSPLLQAMLANYPVTNEATTVHAQLASHYLEGKPYVWQISYGRYWHGYLLYLKPLLCIMDLGEIRALNGIIQALLVILVAFLLYKAKKTAYILPWLAAVIMLLPQAQANSLQYSSCYYAFLLGSLAVLLARNHLEKWEDKIFLYIGIFTAYFDFLTYPIATLGIPAVMYFAVRVHSNWKADFEKMAKLCFCWAFGYGGMWSGKWILGSLITGQSMLADALGKIQERTGNDVYGQPVDAPFQAVWGENSYYFWNNPAAKFVKLFALLLCLLWILSVLRKRVSLRQTVAALPFLIIMLMPVVWYAVLTNHSLQHSFFTNKALVTYLFAWLCLLVKIQEAPNTIKKF